MIVVEAARVSLGNRWGAKLRSALYDGVTNLLPSQLHLAAVGHLLDGDSDTSLATLNFDTLLEIALHEATGEEAQTLLNNSNPLTNGVYHLHGVITPQQTEAVTLTLSDFTGLIANEGSWQYAYLKDALEKGVLIIAGTSYRDPDVRQWLHAALMNKQSKHDAMVLLSREGFALSKEQYADLRSALADQWRAVGLQPVLLEDHADAAQIIRELRHVTSEGYLAPQERSEALWKAHTSRFDELQPEYVLQLEKDAGEMREALDTDALNLTLWIATGRGEIVKWAAQDRVYRSASALRAVETGHDSEWIAGRALGVDEVLFQDLPDGTTRRWSSVLAAPIPVLHPHLPAHSAAVLTIGLPNEASHYEPSSMLWAPSLSRIADAWGSRLAVIAFGE